MVCNASGDVSYNSDCFTPFALLHPPIASEDTQMHARRQEKNGLVVGVQVATLVRADYLFLLTDVDSLYTANPSTNSEAVPIPEVHDITKLQVRQTQMSCWRGCWRG